MQTTKLISEVFSFLGLKSLFLCFALYHFSLLKSTVLCLLFCIITLIIYIFFKIIMFLNH